MKYRLIRTLALTMTVLIFVSLFSCGSKIDGGEKPEHVWASRSIETLEDFVPDDIYISDRNLIITGDIVRVSGNEMLSTRMIIKTDKKNKVVYSEPLSVGEEYGYAISTAAYPDGQMLILARRRDQASGTFKWSLLLWDEGKITALSEDISAMLDDRRGGEMFPSFIAADGDRRIYISDGYLIRAFDESLSPLSDIECDISVDRMITLPDGRVAVSGYNSDNAETVYYIDPDSSSLVGASSDSGGYVVPSGYRAVPGSEGTWLRNDEGIFDGDPSGIILNWINSDVISSQISQIAVIDEEHIAVSLGNINDISDGEVLVMEKLPEDRIPERILLTLAVGSTDYDFPSDVVRFNRSSDRYRIVIRYYTERDENGVFIGEDELKKALSGGDAPDIIRSSDFELTKDLALSGSLLDIGKALDEKGYSEKMLGCFSGGGLYELPVLFGVRMLISKSSEASAGMSVSDFISIDEGLTDGKYLFIDAGRDEVLDLMLRCTLGLYIDTSTGKCDFTSEDFRDTLSFAASFPEGWRYEDTLDGDALLDHENDRDAVYRDGRLVFLDCSIFDPGSMITYEMLFGGDETVFAGYPTSDGSVGAVLESGMSFAVLSSSEHTEGALEFLTFMLENADYGLSPLKDKFDDSLRKIVGTTFFTTGNGYTSWTPGADQEYIDNTTGGAEGLLRVFDEKDAERLTALVDSAGATGGFTGRNGYLTEKVIGIIREEAEMYFDGQKSLDETISVIESRVGVYISEKQ